MPDEPDRDALVIRFRPSDPEAILRSAEKAHRRSGHHRLSVFADVAAEGETEDELITRLLDAAQLSDIRPGGNKRFWLCASAASLFDDGFVFVKDEYPGEEPEHYSVDLGNEPTVEDTIRFAAHFSDSRSWEQDEH